MSELIYAAPIDQFIAEINTLNEGLKKNPLQASDVKITEIAGEDGDGTKREVSLEATEASKFHGTVENPGVKYLRYDWDRLFKQVPVIYMTGEPTVGEALAEFSKRYNVPPFVLEGDMADFTSAVSLQDKVLYNAENYADLGYGFSTNSLGYTGLFKLRVYNDVNNLATTVVNRDLEGLIYPDNTKGDKGSFSILSTPVRFKFSPDFLTILSKVGSGLNGYLLESIAVQTAEYYGNPVGMKDMIKTALVDYKVNITNVGADGTSTDDEDLRVVLTGQSKSDSYTGKFILNIIDFSAPAMS